MTDLKDHTVPLRPPASTVPAVRAHRRVLEASHEALKADLPAALLASAQGQPGAKEALSELRKQIQDITFEIDHNLDAVELARERDAAADETWRASVHAMPPHEAVEGITGGDCAHRCLRGVPGGCVLGGGCIGAGSECYHPFQRREQFHRDERGLRTFPLRHHERASAVFDEACKTIRVREKFS